MNTTLYKAEKYFYAKSYSLAKSHYRQQSVITSWNQEQWYCDYMILRCTIEEGNIEDAYLILVNQTSLHLTSGRWEPTYHMCKALREAGDYEKAWNLLRDHVLGMIIAKTITTPTFGETSLTSLFVEKDVYSYQLLYEASLVCPEEQLHTGLILSYTLLNSTLVPFHIRKCIKDNLIWYTESIPESHSTLLSIKPQPHNSTSYTYSTPSLWGDHFSPENIVYRLVNYNIDSQGKYHILFGDNVQTRNFSEIKQDYLEITSVSENVFFNDQAPIKGLEDLRLIKTGDSEGYGMAATYEYQLHQHKHQQKVTQVLLRITDHTNIHIENVLSDGTSHQKNWVWAGFPYIITDWYPHITVKALQNSVTVPYHTIPSPPLLAFARGSSNGVLYKDQMWFVLHSVVDPPSGPRHYLHFLVTLDTSLTSLRQISLPFIFTHRADIEFCNAFDVTDEGFIFGYSVRDSKAQFKRVDFTGITLKPFAAF